MGSDFQFCALLMTRSVIKCQSLFMDIIISALGLMSSYHSLLPEPFTLMSHAHSPSIHFLCPAVPAQDRRELVCLRRSTDEARRTTLDKSPVHHRVNRVRMRQPFTLTPEALESQINLTSMLFDCRRKEEYP